MSLDETPHRPKHQNTPPRCPALRHSCPPLQGLHNQGQCHQHHHQHQWRQQDNQQGGPDGIEEAARYGITAVIQPGGSVRDDEVIAAANRLGLAMVFTGVRHFRH